MAQGTHYRGRSDIRQVNADEYIPARDYTPHSQQTMESHVLVPLAIAAIVALFVMGMVSALMVAIGYVYAWVSVAAWSVTFLYVFLWRIGVGDSLLWKLEEFLRTDIDGDGGVGIPFAPRSIPYNVNGEASQVAMPPQHGKLYDFEWAEVAIAILYHQARVSRRGIASNCKLSESKANDAAAHLNGAYAKNGEINQAGFDFLVPYLADMYAIALPRPTS